MAAPVTQNAFKGYSYQQQVYVLFTFIMDINNTFSSIDAEVIESGNANFDDIVLCGKKDKYYIQVKNYNDVKFEKIKIEKKCIVINKVKSNYKVGYKNIVVLYNADIQTNSKFYDIDVYEDENIIIMPINMNSICNFVNKAYFRSERALKILVFACEKISSGEFYVAKADLPVLKLLNQKLAIDTQFVRENFLEEKTGVFFVIGKPGIGKSHFVNEVSRDNPKAITYRFWISNNDKDKKTRLEYGFFIEELSYLTFKTRKKHSEEEIVTEIEEKNFTLLIDGLDHVENYNKNELQAYFDLFEKLNNTKTIIFSRPLIHEHRNDFILKEWTYDETLEYLLQSHSIKDAEVSGEIYRLANGYPLLTYYISCYYKEYKRIQFSEVVNDLDDYYTKILSEVDTKDFLNIFYITNDYITRDDIKKMFPSKMVSDLLINAINRYSFLFDESLNRINIFHDSFRNFIVRKAVIDEDSIKQLINTLDDLMLKDFRFKSRINAFKTSDSVKVKILKDYCDFDNFLSLLNNNFDIESIKSFFQALFDILQEQDPSVLNIQEYYSLVLINQCCNNIEIYNESTYQRIMFLLESNIDELRNIESNGYVFKVMTSILEYNKEENRYTVKKIVKSSEANSSFEKFYKYRLAEIDLNEVIKEKYDIEFLLSSINEKDYAEQEEVLSNIIVNIIYFDNEFCDVKEYFLEYLKSDNSYNLKIIFNNIFRKFGVRYIMKDYRFLHIAKWKLFRLGFYEDINPYVFEKTSELRTLARDKNADEMDDYIANFIALSRKKKEYIDEITELNFFYLLPHYYDNISFDNLPNALVVFEDKGIIDESKSFEIMAKISMKIEHYDNLYLKYFMLKGKEYFAKKIEEGYLDSGDIPFNLFSLDTDIINIIPPKYIIKELNSYFQTNYYSKIIEYCYIANVCNSVFRHYIKKKIAENNYRIFKSTAKYSRDRDKKFEKIGFLVSNDEEEKTGNIKSYLEKAKLEDGRYQTFNQLDLFDDFEDDELRIGMLEILHTAILSRVGPLSRRCSIDSYLGNIPYFANSIDFELDWEVLYNIMIKYLEVQFILE